MKTLTRTIGIISALLLLPLLASAAPSLINYQGRLVDATGNPLTGSLSILFSIYDAPTGGNLKWSETQPNIIPDNGIFRVSLGSVATLPASVFDSDARYLEIKIGSDPVMTPRTQLLSTPYSLYSANLGSSGSQATISTDTVISASQLRLANFATASFPAGMGKGALAYDSTTDHVSYWNGSSWLSLLAGAATSPWNSVTGKVVLVTDTDNVGVGTAAPIYKLDVTGGIRATSTMTASAYYGDKYAFSQNVEISSEADTALGAGVRVSSNVYIVGFSSAAKYYGDGSALTGIVTSDKVLKVGDIMTGTLVMNSATAFNTTTQNALVISTNVSASGQVKVGDFAAAPAAAAIGAGSLYYKTGAGAGLYVSNGASWSPLASGGASPWSDDGSGNIVQNNTGNIVKIDNTTSGSLTIAGGMTAAGVAIIGTDGKIPAIDAGHFASLNGSALINVSSIAVQSINNENQIVDGVITSADLAGSIADSKLATIATAGKVSNSATTATNSNTPSAIVQRDASGNFSAGMITANVTGNVTGNADTATSATNATNAVSFTGSLAGEVTGNQGTTVVGNAAVIGKVITGYSSGAGAVAATDTILEAINKLNGNDALKAPLAGATFTGAISATNLSNTNSGDNAANTTYANDYRAANFVAGTDYLAPTGSGASLTGVVKTETDPVVKAINGLVKSNGTTIAAAVAGTDYQAPLTAGTDYLAPTGSGASLTGVVKTETDPVVKAITGLVKSDGTTISAAVAGTDYLAPTGSGASLTGVVKTETDPVVKAITGLVKSNGTTISAAAAGTDYQSPLTAGTDYLAPNGSGASLTGVVKTETDPVVKAITGLVKSNGTTISAAVAGTDYQSPLTAGTDYLAPNGSGASLTGVVKTETDPVVKAITGLVKSDGSTIAAAVAGTDYVASEADPVVKAITGLVKSNGTTISAAVAGTDYQAPLTAGTDYLAPTGSGASLTGVVKTETDPVVKAITGLVKSNGTVISAAVAGTDYLAPNGVGAPVYSLLGGDATTTAQTVTDTGLSVALAASATYEFEAELACETSADTDGTRYAVNFDGGGSTGEAFILYGADTATATRSERITGMGTLSAPFLKTSAQSGGVLIKGVIITTNPGNLIIQHAKAAGGTSTVFTGSYLKATRIN